MYIRQSVRRVISTWNNATVTLPYIYIATVPALKKTDNTEKHRLKDTYIYTHYGKINFNIQLLIYTQTNLTYDLKFEFFWQKYISDLLSQTFLLISSHF